MAKMLLGLTPRLQHIWNKITRLRKDRTIKWEGSVVTWVCNSNKAAANCTMSHKLSFFWPHLTACGILVPWPGIELGPSAKKAQSPDYWTTREFPKQSFYCYNKGSNSLLARKCTLKEAPSVLFHLKIEHLGWFFYQVLGIAELLKKMFQ